MHINFQKNILSVYHVNMMKTAVIFIVFLSTILIASCSKKDGSSITDSTSSTIQTIVTYVGSAGYVLESENKKIMIDAPFDDFVATFQVPVYTEETEGKMANGEEPFNNVDLFLITHEHRGHFDFTLLGQCFTQNAEAILVTTQGVFDILESNVDNFTGFKNRIVVPELEFYESLDTTILEIPLRISKSEHWGPVDLFNFEFNLNEMEVAFVLEQENYEKMNNIDLLFCDSLTSVLNPKHIILCHQSGTANIADLLAQSQDLDDVTFLTVSMETATFTKENDNISVSVP
jgi:hypothetical protein